MGFLIEYDGDDTTILADAVKFAADRAVVAQVTLRPTYDGRRNITSVADYVLSEYVPSGTVLLTLWDNMTDAPHRNPDGGLDIQRVHVHDIAELHVY